MTRLHHYDRLNTARFVTFSCHNCRTAETVVEKINYCHNNPVKRGLVTEPAQRCWSSYN